MIQHDRYAPDAGADIVPLGDTVNEGVTVAPREDLEDGGVGLNLRKDQGHLDLLMRAYCPGAVIKLRDLDLIEYHERLDCCVAATSPGPRLV